MLQSPSLHHIWCCGCYHRATWVSQLLFLHCVWYCSHGCCAACGFVVAVVVPCGCCGRHLCTTGGVVVMVIVPRVVLPSPSLCHVWCCSRGCCTMWVSQSPLLCPHGVSRSQSLCCVGFTVTAIAPCRCYSCHLCAMCGVVVTIVAPHVVSRSPSLCVVVPCVVSPSQLLRHVGVAIAIFVPCVVLQLQLLHHVWFHGCGCCATWVSPSLLSCYM